MKSLNLIIFFFKLIRWILLVRHISSFFCSFPSEQTGNLITWDSLGFIGLMSDILFYSCTWEGENALLDSLASFCGTQGDGGRGLVVHQNHLMEGVAMPLSCGSCLFLELLTCSSVALLYTARNRPDINPSSKCTQLSPLFIWSPKTHLAASIQKHRRFTLCSKSYHSKEKENLILILPSSPLPSSYSTMFGYSGMSSLHLLWIHISNFPMHGFIHLAVLQLLTLLWIASF